jgi:hypothetical protein
MDGWKAYLWLAFQQGIFKSLKIRGNMPHHAIQPPPRAGFAFGAALIPDNPLLNFPANPREKETT